MLSDTPPGIHARENVRRPPLYQRQKLLMWNDDALTFASNNPAVCIGEQYRIDSGRLGGKGDDQG